MPLNLPASSAPRWLVRSETLKLEIVVHGKPVRTYDIPPVVNAYKGDTRYRVLSDEVAKLKTIYAQEFGKIRRTWDLAQALTECDKAYVKAHMAWWNAASADGLDAEHVKRMFNSLERLSQGVTPAGWAALDAVRLSKTKKETE